MKDFIYLDTDCLNSYLAQINNGLPTNVQESTDDITQTTEEDTSPQIHSNLEGKIGFSFASLSSKFSSDSDLKKSVFSETEAGRKMVEKVMQDNMCESFINYVKENNLLCENNTYEIGKFALIKNASNILDFSYLEEIVEKNNADAILNCITMNQKIAIETLKNTDKNKQLIKEKANLKSVENQIKNSFKIISTVIKAFNAMMPTRCTIFAQNTLIPLKETYLRESFKEFGFKYDRFTVFGRITKSGLVTQNEENPTLINSFSNLQHAMIPVLQSCGIPVTEDCYIMSPIALYFE